MIIYLVNSAIKPPSQLIHQLLTARPRSILRHNVKMTIWRKSCLPSSSNKPGSAQCGYWDGGARWRLWGVWTPGGKGSNSLYIQERRDQKAESLKSRRGGLRVAPLLGEPFGYLHVYWCGAPSPDTLSHPYFLLSCWSTTGFPSKTLLYQRRHLNCLSFSPPCAALLFSW